MFEAAFRQARTGMAIYDGETYEPIAVNEQFAGALGTSGDQLSTVTLDSLFVGALDDSTTVTEVLARAHSGDEPTLRIEAPGVAGSPRIATLSEISLTDGLGLLLSLTDQAPETLGRESPPAHEGTVELPGEQLEELVQRLSGAVYRADPETLETTYISQAIEDIHDFTPTEWIENPELWAEKLHPDDRDEVFEKFEQLAGENEPGELEYRIETRDGEFRLVLDNFNWHYDEDGDPSALIGILVDITDRKEKTQELAETRRRLDLALEGTNTGIWEWNLATDELTLSPTYERLLGLGDGGFQGTFDDFAFRVHQADIDRMETAISNAIEMGETHNAQFRLQHVDGGWRWFEARGQVVEKDGDEYLVGTATDITEQKSREEELGLRQQQFEDLIGQLPQAYYTIDEEWTITYCNDVIEQRIGRPAAELIGTSFWDQFTDIEGTHVEEMLTQVMETGEPGTCEFHYEKYNYWVELQAYPYEDGIAVISTDITEQKQKLESLLDTLPVVFFRIDTDGTTLDSRGRALEQLGLEPGEIVGENIYEVYAGYDEIQELIDRALEGEEFTHKLDMETVVFQTQFTPVYRDGEFAGTIGVSIDITELERQREQLEFFNSILRHDVLNGLTVIKTRGELLADQLDGDHKDWAETIVDWCDTTTAVTQRVRRVLDTLTTPGEDQEMLPIDVSRILQERLDELERTYPRVTFERDLEGDVRVAGDGLLTDVLGNVLTNSIEHNEREDLVIRTSVSATDDMVTITIEDNGTGITDERKETVFRRGETAHAKETGSGFGLFFVDVMVDKYDGDVWIEDSNGGGARFVLELPRLPQEQSRQAAWNGGTKND